MNLNQVTVPSTDVEASVEFYRRLGLIQIVADSDYARFVCPDGDSTFSVHRVDEPPRGPGVVVYFECGDLDATVGALRDGGIGFDSPPADRPWLWREAHLRDPDGNAICLYHAGENRKNPPWRLPAADA